MKLFQRNPLALLLLAVIGTLIGLVPLFAPDSEPHDEHH